MWDKEELAKGTMGGRGQKLPTQCICLIPLTQVFVFRSDSVNNNWKDIYTFVDDVVKKFPK